MLVENEKALLFSSLLPPASIYKYLEKNIYHFLSESPNANQPSLCRQMLQDDVQFIQRPLLPR
jgi:hypothetical protein